MKFKALLSGNEVLASISFQRKRSVGKHVGTMYLMIILKLKIKRTIYKEVDRQKHTEKNRIVCIPGWP